MAATSSTESRCPSCSTPGALPGERCSGCRDLIELDRCFVSSWSGHQSAAFVARREDGTIVGTSATFQWSDEDDGGPRAALDELVRALEEAGWQASEHSLDEVWYERGFTRLMALPGESLPQPLPAPAGAVAPDAPVLSLAADPPRRGWGARVVTLVSLVGLIVAGGLVGMLIGWDPPRAADPASRPSAAAPRAPVTASKPAPKPEPKPQKAAAPVHVARPLTSVSVLAARDSWLELRRGASTGAVLYSGVLPAGHDLHVRAARVWARFGAAANLQVTVNGRRVPLQGTLEKTFSR